MSGGYLYFYYFLTTIRYSARVYLLSVFQVSSASNKYKKACVCMYLGI